MPQIEGAPEPLLPADVDLRDRPDMMFAVQRFRDSGILSKRSDAEIVAALLLWCASWHQVPAASLPDDDAELARLAHYGRDVKGFRKVKEGALHGFIVCSDGNYWHPVVAEKAAYAWNRKQDERHKKAYDRARKFNDERKARGEPPLQLPHPPYKLTTVDEGEETQRYRYIDAAGVQQEGKRKAPPIPDGIPAEFQRNSSGTILELPPISEPVPAVKGKERKGKERKVPTPSAAELEKPRGKRANPIPLPPSFGISDRVRQWAQERGYTRLDERFEQFIGYVRAHGKTYVDWDDAFMNAIRGDWAKLNGRQETSLAERRGSSIDTVIARGNGDGRVINGSAERVDRASVLALPGDLRQPGRHDVWGDDGRSEGEGTASE